MGPDEALDRETFFTVSGILESGLLIVALLLAYWLEIDVWASVRFDLFAVIAGIMAAIPLCGLSWWLNRTNVPLGRDIREAVHQSLGPLLADCMFHDLVLLSVMVGIAEEVLFRGVLQPAFARHGMLVAIVATNLMFGLAHAVSRSYIVMAGLVGVYLSLLMAWSSEPNLLIPILAHALCDLYSFWLVRSEQRSRPAIRSDASE